MMVFSREWFRENQTALLRFANTAYGRRVLRINGRRSAIGKRPIVRIDPHAITWRNADGTCSTEFRTHDKYAKRLYYAYKPLWYAMHGWDMAIANRLRPSLNLGFDSLTSYPDAGSGPGVANVDGYAFRQSVTGESFSTIRAGAGTGRNTTENRLLVGLYATTTTDTYSFLVRALMTFDTSDIIAGDVTAATLSLYMDSKTSGVGQPGLEITAATPVQNNSLSTADYQRLGSDSFASASYAALTLGGYHDFTLDADGRANVNLTGISAFGARLDWDLNNSFGGTWASGQASTFSPNQADVAGTSTDPKLVVTYTPDLLTSVSGSLLLGGGVTAAKTTHETAISGSLLLGENINVTKDVAPVAGKEYVYRVYEEDGTYIGVWRDVADELQFSQRINTPGTTTTVRLARSVNTTVEQRDTLETISSETLTTQDGEDLVANHVTNNTVGEDTDVDLNYNVDVYVHYGGFETLETIDGQVLTTQDGEEILFSIGAPLGRRIFSAWIMDYAATYGESDGLEVTLASHGTELANQVIHSGSDTTVTYSSVDHGQVIKNILAMNSGKIGSGTTTVASTGETISPTFRLNTILEGIDAVYKQSPDGWYWFGNVAENEVYFQEKSATPQHTFVLGKHIKALRLSKSIENIKNELYFVGGDTGSGILYKKYTDTSSVDRLGLDRQTDRRVTTSGTAAKRKDKTFARYKDPIYTTNVTIPSEVYDIESIELGDVVTFANFGNFIDGLQLQIVALHYSPYSARLELGELLERQRDIIEKISDTIDDEQYETVPTAPS